VQLTFPCTGWANQQQAGGDQPDQIPLHRGVPLAKSSTGKGVHSLLDNRAAMICARYASSGKSTRIFSSKRSSVTIEL
jgi:hypothetical protein